MLTRDDWRALTAIFWEYQELVLARAGDTTPRTDLALWLRDHDMPLLEIDRQAQRALPWGDPLGTPGELVCYGVCYYACRFGFDAATGELVRGVLVWELVAAYRDAAGDWRRGTEVGHGLPPPRRGATLELHGLREAGEYRVVVARRLGQKGD